MAYTIKKWKLDELFPGFDSPELQAAFDNVEEEVASFEGVRGKLKPDMDADQFLEVVRAWETKRGATAQESAGEIHTDLQRGFVRAEVVAYEDLISLGSMSEAKAKGKFRLEGKEYLVKDGDIVHIRSSL